ncbi:MAG: hypothetical protein ACYCY0_09980 [Acidithiobacillus ferrivorans]
MRKIIAAVCCIALVSPVCALASTPLHGATPIPPTQIHFTTMVNYRVADTHNIRILYAAESGSR